MSSTKPPDAIDTQDLQEWLEALGLPLESAEDDRALRDQLRDGIFLCQLVNRIKPGSVENIKPKRSSGDAEENILRFLQSCTTLGVKKIFKPLDLLDDRRDFNSVLITLQQLYNIASNLGMGIQFTRHLSRRRLQQNGTVVGGSGGSSPLDMEESNGVEHVYRSLYAFSGGNEDELQFEKGDLITVTKVVDGGWWEGVCNGRVGWFPGNYVQEFAGEPTVRASGHLSADKRDSLQVYHNLVVQDILDSERTYVHDLHTLLSTYLVPLKTANIVLPREVDNLIGNLPELNKWQQSFFKSLEDCSRLPIPQQNMGTLFVKASHEMETLYSTYCANHPKAVAVLTDNSDKLSAFMESRGAVSPGMLTLTSNLSKPFRRLEKYPGLLKELQRYLTEGHADTDSVAAGIETYTGISKRTQEIRKWKDMEHEMLSNPVKGYSGQMLSELGECTCVLQANQALNAEEVDERFFLVFPSSFIILAVGQSLSGYELTSNFQLNTVSVKKGTHSEHWPYPVEILHRQESIHASFSSEKDRNTFTEAIGRLEGVPTRQAPQRAHSFTSTRVVSSRASAASLFRCAYPPRAMRQMTTPIHRAHHWGFKSLQLIPPISPQQVVSLRDRELRSPKSAKKFMYPVVKKKRTSKSIDDILSTTVSRPAAVENKEGDTAILRVIETYCASGKTGITTAREKRLKEKGAGQKNELGPPIPRSMSHSEAYSTRVAHPGRPGRPHIFSSVLEERVDRQRKDPRLDKSCTLPSSGRYGAAGKPSPSFGHTSKADVPAYRPLSPILLERYGNEPPRGFLNEQQRRRAESVGSYSYARVKKTII